MSQSVFISYSHFDETWKNRLVAQLGTLEWEGLLSTWHDGLIGMGADWLSEIETALEEAQVAVMLVSPHFLTSPFIRSMEVPALIERRKAESLHIIPLIVSPCPWRQITWLSRTQARPLNGKTLLELGRARAEKALAALAEEISALLQSTSRPNMQVSQPLAPAIYRISSPSRATAPDSDSRNRYRDLPLILPRARPKRKQAGLARPEVVADFLAASPDRSSFGLSFGHLHFESTIPTSSVSSVALFTFQDERYIIKKTPAYLCDEKTLRLLCGREFSDSVFGLPVSLQTPAAINATEDYLYELLPFIEGITLDLLIKKNRWQLQGDILVAIYEGFARILNMLCNVIHRDIRPANILFTGREMSLIDVTFACQADEPSARVSNRSYSAPEQKRGSPCIKSDWYSLGATLFFLANGYPPDWNHQEDLIKALADIQAGGYTFELDVLGRVPEELTWWGGGSHGGEIGSLIYFLLQPDPEERPKSLPKADEHTAHLNGCITGVLDLGKDDYLVFQDSGWEILKNEELESILIQHRDLCRLDYMTPDLRFAAESFLAGKPRWLRAP